MDGFEPYLSVVVTSRNDDHGGNLLRRMQIFVDGLIAQCTRHNLTCELIVVEWNPPADRPRLAEALLWPEDTGLCRVRIIEVPQKLHRRFKHARALPLFQMIGKNVGIRRARGQFILATNIDILLSDELLTYIVQGNLEAGRLYRIDRHDVLGAVPYPAPVAEQLGYCQNHLIRVNAPEGTFPLTPAGEYTLAAEDIVAPDQGLLFGAGWFAPENSGGASFRWAAEDAVLIVNNALEQPRTIRMELEPGPGVGFRPFVLEVLDEDDRVVARGLVRNRQLVAFRLPEPCKPIEYFRLRAEKGGRPTPNDWRVLNFRVFHCRRVAAAAAEVSPAEPNLNFHAQTLPLTRRGVLELQDIAAKDLGVRFGPGWHGVEEWNGNRFRWVANDAALVFVPPFKADTLTFAIEPGPGVDYRPFQLQVRDEAGRPLSVHPINGEALTTVTFPLQRDQRQAFVLHLEGGGIPSPSDPRLLNFRVFGPIRPGRPVIPWTRRNLATRLARFAIPLVGDVLRRRRAHALADPIGAQQPASSHRQSRAQSNIICPLPLHLNASGDFTLMARQHWFDLQGYPEFETYSLHIDSLFCYMAIHSGIAEFILREPMRIYHIEHDVGSGWTPEGEGKLRQRLTASKIAILEAGQVMRWATQMRRQNGPLQFNRDDWGLRDESLRETTLTAPLEVAARG